MNENCKNVFTVLKSSLYGKSKFYILLKSSKNQGLWLSSDGKITCGRGKNFVDSEEVEMFGYEKV